MRWLVHAQLPPGLAQWLVDQGHDATHVAEHGMVQASDEAIWRYAVEAAAAIITKDEDFAILRARNAEGPAIVWLRFPNLRRRDLLRRFEVVLPAIQRALENGETLIEIV